ncbi:MAG: ankyrin repeat domain-containing protein, partial [Proteobacteria bacterium]|nr:ankyrin repeat domain-containing protein [Pseudomonadota bacterium]
MLSFISRMLAFLLPPYRGLNQYLMEAAEHGDVFKVKSLLAKRANVNASNKKGGTALKFAVQNGHIEVVKLLLERGAEVDAKNKAGSTALTGAAGIGHIEMVKVLLDN